MTFFESPFSLTNMFMGKPLSQEAHATWLISHLTWFCKPFLYFVNWLLSQSLLPLQLLSATSGTSNICMVTYQIAELFCFDDLPFSVTQSMARHIDGIIVQRCLICGILKVSVTFFSPWPLSFSISSVP